MHPRCPPKYNSFSIAMRDLLLSRCLVLVLVRLLRQVVGMPMIVVSRPDSYLHVHPSPSAFEFYSSLFILPVAQVTMAFGFQVRLPQGALAGRPVHGCYKRSAHHHSRGRVRHS